MNRKLASLNTVIDRLEKAKRDGEIADFKILPTFKNEEFREYLRKKYNWAENRKIGFLTNWSDYIVLNMLNLNRKELNRPVFYDFIKLVEDKNGNIFAAQHGKGRFSSTNTGELELWDIPDKEKPKLSNFLIKHNLKWKDLFVFVKINNIWDEKESLSTEDKLEIWFNTFN